VPKIFTQKDPGFAQEDSAETRGQTCFLGSSERGYNNMNGLTDVCTANGSNQGQNPAVTGLFVPSSLDSGKRFRGGLVFKAHRLVYHSTLGLRRIKKRRRERGEAPCPRRREATRASSPVSNVAHICGTYKTVKANVAHIRHSGVGFQGQVHFF